MVELDGGDNCAVRAVMEKLGALVEKGGVVLVAFDHKIGSPSEAIVRIKVARYSAHEHRRVASRRGPRVRHHCGRRGLAMRPGYHQNPPIAQEEMPPRFGH